MDTDAALNPPVRKRPYDWVVMLGGTKYVKYIPSVRMHKEAKRLSQ